VPTWWVAINSAGVVFLYGPYTRVNGALVHLELSQKFHAQGTFQGSRLWVAPNEQAALRALATRGV
jgi:hypothetical protein